MDPKAHPSASPPPASSAVRSLTTSGLRNLAAGSVELGPGLTLVWGPNGAGKSSVLEALCLALTGQSPRTARQREAIAFGSELARAEAIVEAEGRDHEFLWAATRDGERRHLLDGGPAGRDATAARPALTAFVPDRLVLVKGAPGARRAHLDRLCEAFWPARRGTRERYRRALAQRNALLASARGGEPPSLEAWDRELAAAGAELMAARAEAIERLGPHVGAAAAELGLESASVEYRPRSRAASAAELVDELRSRRDSDLARRFSGHGPHLDEVDLRIGDRSARRYGSQGEQRTVLLSLLLGERALLLEARGVPPLMLLDDVMSELDPDRRDRLAARLTEGSGQTLVTATEPGQLPTAAERWEVALERGRVRPRLATREAA